MGKLGPVGVGSERTWMDALRWVRGKTTPQSASLTLEHFVNHIDHVCQLAGNARHARAALKSGQLREDHVLQP